MMTVSVLDLIPFYVKDSKSYSSVHPLKSLEWNTMDNWRDLWVCLSASEEFVTPPYSQQWLISKWYAVQFFPPSSYFFANKFKSMHSHQIVFFSIFTLLGKSVNYNYFGPYDRKLLLLFWSLINIKPWNSVQITYPQISDLLDVLTIFLL